MRIIKKLGIISTVVILVISLCACQKEAAPVTEDTINIRFSFWEPGMGKTLERGLQSVVEAYEELHPNINIELEPHPVGSYLDWIKAKIASNDLPEIESCYPSELEIQYKAGVIADITEALKGESAYEKGTAWKDTFISDYLIKSNNTYPNVISNIPFFGTELAMFYNKTVYDELGLSEPVTWKEFMYNCEVIKQSNRTPIVMMTQKQASNTWITREIGQGLSVKRYLKNKDININGDLLISGYEENRALLTGVLNYEEDTQFHEDYKKCVEYLTQYLKYCNSSTELEETVAKMIFLNGEAVHINTGSWDVKDFLDNPQLDFEIGTFKFPQFTDEDSEYAGHIIDGSAQSLAVTNSAYNQEGKYEAVIDFLQFLTSKDVYQKFVNDTIELPVIKGVKRDPRLDDFVSEGYYASGMFDTMVVSNDILLGNVPEINEQYFKDIQEKKLKIAEEFVKKNNLSAEDNYYMYEGIKLGTYTE